MSDCVVRPADLLAVHRRAQPLADRAAAATVIDRTVELPIDPRSLWDSISTARGWGEWLVDLAVFDGAITERSSGVVVDAAAVRDVRIDRIDDGRMIGFTWWERADPSTVSHVTLEIAEPDEHRSGVGSVLSIREELIVVESSAGVAADGLLAADRARLSWEVRVGSLWACTVAAALV